jgi:gluconolactonase
MSFRVVTAIAVLVGASCAIVGAACSLTGPDAPPRESGCIDVGCGSVDGGGTRPPLDTGTSTEPPIAYGDPLEGTSKQATLIKGRFRFVEGPVWIAGRLLFTDAPAGQIHELLIDGGTAPYRNNSNGANGLAIDQLGNLIACEGVGKRLTRATPIKGSPANVIADKYQNQPFNAPNDVVVRVDGNVYFTDPNYSGDPNTQDDEAVYRMAPGGELTRVAHDFNKPNGIALSPDQNTLFVVDNGAGKLLAAPLDGAGAASAFTELADVPGGDGMGVDDAGNLYVADDNGIDVFNRTGKKIGTIAVAVKPTNCAFGGTDRRTLYITANGDQTNPATGLYSIDLNVPGLP